MYNGVAFHKIYLNEFVLASKCEKLHLEVVAKIKKKWDFERFFVR
jgi:hypothetical protein